MKTSSHRLKNTGWYTHFIHAALATQCLSLPLPAVRYLGVPDDEAAGHGSAKTPAGDGAAVQPAAAHGRHASPGGPRHVPAARAAALPATAGAADPGKTARETGQRLGKLALHAAVDLELA